jgi:fucose 4-O-acetylase-like acetyltransferase
MGIFQQASELAQEAGPERNRYADFLRVVAIIAVVVGHWLVMDVRLEDGLPTGVNALEESTWIHWGTWAFQVIPLFFMVGGFANAVSWRAHRDGDWASWLRRRAVRLLWPTALFVAAGLILTILATLADPPRAVLSQATWAVAIILWFLAVYLVVAALTPLSIAAHDRWGWGFLVLLVILVVVADGVRFIAGNEVPAYANYALVWGTFHQIGFMWSDDQLPSARSLWAISLTSFVILFALVVWGPYPVSMVGVPGAEVQNTGPPTLALLLVGFVQIGVALALRSVIAPWLEGDSRLWTVVVIGNIAIMSIFLWHVVPVPVLAWILSMLGFSPQWAPGTSEWLAFQTAWVFALAVLLVPLVMVVQRFERPPDRLDELASRPGDNGIGLAAGLVGTGVAAAGLARLTIEGFWVGGPTVIPIWGALAFFGGSALAIGSGALAEDRTEA